jgi:hypothetical protein
MRQKKVKKAITSADSAIDTVLKALLLILKHGKDENAVKQHFPHFFLFMRSIRIYTVF